MTDTTDTTDPAVAPTASPAEAPEHVQQAIDATRACVDANAGFVAALDRLERGASPSRPAPDPNRRLMDALEGERVRMREALDDLDPLQEYIVDDEEMLSKVGEMSERLRNGAEYIACLRRLLVGRSLREVHDAFGAPGDFGYEHPVGMALAEIYSAPPHRTIFDEMRAERERARKKHAASNMEEMPLDDTRRFTILTEELGEVAKEFNEARWRHAPVDLAKLRKELIQLASAAAAWADNIPATEAKP